MMHGIILGECINAIFQGNFNRQVLASDQSLTGTGIIIDDQFNLFISEWNNNNLNGKTFIRMANGMIIYGYFADNQPTGVIGMQMGDCLMLISSKVNIKPISWQKEAIFLNKESNMLYVVELIENSLNDGFGKNQLNQSIPCDSLKNQWKVKIIQRCLLQTNGTLSVSSKIIKNYQKTAEIKFSQHQFTTKQQNYGRLIASIMGDKFVTPNIISLSSFLKCLPFGTSKMIGIQMLQDGSEQNDLLFIGVKQPKLPKANRRLGIIIDAKTSQVHSFGNYDQNINLQGLGAQFNKHKQAYIGIFKQNLLVKEYVHNNSNNLQNITSFQIRELLSQQHLKSMNYVHHCHYISQLASIASMGRKILNYVTIFQKQYQKRHLSYNDTINYNSSFSSDYLNVQKYVDLHNKNQIYQEELSQMEKHGQTGKLQSKKPGFIRDKSQINNKQKSNTPTKRNLVQKKSPFRSIRLKGKVYNYSENNNSPNKYMGQRSQQCTIKRHFY